MKYLIVYENLEETVLKKFNILIPMAGAGSRFSAAGYELPKPLIDVDGAPMIKRVVENIGIQGQYIFVVQKDHCEKYGVVEKLQEISPGCKTVIIDGLTEGAACTTLLAKEYIDEETPLLIANSDQWVDWSPEHFVQYVEKIDADGAMLTFSANSDKHSYVKVDRDGYVTEVAEKKVISNHATVGIYYWKSGSEYVSCAEEMISRQIRYNGEFYVCPVYEILLERKGEAIIYPVPRMLGMGTPGELENYLDKTRKETGVKIFRRRVDEEKYIICDYDLSSKTNLRDAAWALAIGQSVGNPNVRNQWETDELFQNHSCMVIGNESKLKEQTSGKVKIAFPIANTDFVQDGVAHLLCQFMGGQMDIDIVEKCHLLKVSYPKSVERDFFKGPKYGISGIRDFMKCHDKPVFGGIVKPKIGVSSDVLLEMVKEMVDGGVNFIKEDEIMANPACCPLEERVPKIMEYVKGKGVVYSVCINGDPLHVLEKAKKVAELGGNSVHINFWSGLGVYKSIRDLDLPLFIHFQKSGDKVLTAKTHDYRISWDVLCDLAGLMGADFIHAGMWGGYLSDNESELRETLRILRERGVMPALSCGMHPGLVEAIKKRFGNDFMANVGGAIHGHPGGSLSGAKAMRQSIDKDYKEEYDLAIAKWGLVE